MFLRLRQVVFGGCSNVIGNYASIGCDAFSFVIGSNSQPSAVMESHRYF